LACGSADIVWEWDTSPWDVAAGILMVRCSGGKVTGKNGEEYVLDFENDNINELLASNGQLHSNILEEINKG
jgi:myo-inositol-1(or 4)-monophosphatase